MQRMLALTLVLLSMPCGAQAQTPPTDPQAVHEGHGAPADAGAAPTDLDPMRDAGVPAASRVQALEAKAKAANQSVAAATWQAIEACNTCLAANDLAAVLASRPATEVKPLEPALVAKLKDTANTRARAAAARTLLALPADQQPAEAKALQPTMLKTVSVVGRMSWDPKEFQASPGALVCIEMANPDTMQHNMLLVAPGALSEIGVAADKLGEGPEGKRRQFVPDSPKVLQVMGLVAPGQSMQLWFFAPDKPGTYPLVCTYPGHWRLMNGKLKVK
jgi:uncharacterized cupredoxin-like copper-binding protein